MCKLSRHCLSGDSIRGTRDGLRTLFWCNLQCKKHLQNGQLASLLVSAEEVLGSYLLSCKGCQRYHGSKTLAGRHCSYQDCCLDKTTVCVSRRGALRQNRNRQLQSTRQNVFSRNAVTTLQCKRAIEKWCTKHVFLFDIVYAYKTKISSLAIKWTLFEKSSGIWLFFLLKSTDFVMKQVQYFAVSFVVIMINSTSLPLENWPIISTNTENSSIITREP